MNLSQERKHMQKNGDLPEWFTTGGWQLFKKKYLYGVPTPRFQYRRIADTAASYLPEHLRDEYADKFFKMIWNGWVSLSTPVVANMGTDRGLPVSCAGAYVPDSINGIYSVKHETAMLTKNGFGTAGYVGDIRPRGSAITGGGTSTGVLPVLKSFFGDMDYVAQGQTRRGSWAGYLPLMHGDFDEVLQYLEGNPNGTNLGWTVDDETLKRLNNHDPEVVKRYADAMRAKMTTGKGYWFFPDKAMRKRPATYIKHGLDIKSPQLCNEIMLHSDSNHTYTCVLASMNIAKYDEWKNTTAVFDAIVFLDCVVSNFLDQAKNIPGLEKAVRCTEKGRALGLGVLGYHTYMLEHGIAFESFDSHVFNKNLFKDIRTQSEDATQYLGRLLGEPEWCKGFDRRNTHLLAIAPTKSSSVLMGGISEGINPVESFVYTQRTPAGEIDRIEPTFLALMKRKGRYNKKMIADIRDHNGSCQHVDWLSEREKEVFKTAFEINQNVIVREASTRAEFLDQWQSLNLFFGADEDEAVINDVHKKAFLDENILGLYYIRSTGEAIGKSASTESCESCQ